MLWCQTNRVEFTVSTIVVRAVYHFTLAPMDPKRHVHANWFIRPQMLAAYEFSKNKKLIDCHALQVSLEQGPLPLVNESSCMK